MRNVSRQSLPLFTYLVALGPVTLLESDELAAATPLAPVFFFMELPDRVRQVRQLLEFFR